MASLSSLPRYCHPSSSRFIVSATPLRRISLIPPRLPDPVPFFTPPFQSPNNHNGLQDKGKGKAPPPGSEGEVDDKEWEMRAARAMLHLQDALPRFSHAQTAVLFPPDIYSANVVLKLPHPLPIKVSSLSAYSMAFSVARNGMQALHTDLRTSLNRMTVTPSPGDLAPRPDLTPLMAKAPIHRQKQIRVSVSVHGTLRLPPHHEAVWQTSSLYTISPVSGLIMSHEVESIRPLPGEGVGEWLRSRLLGWTARQAESGEAALPCPRAVSSDLLRCKSRKELYNVQVERRISRTA